MRILIITLLSVVSISWICAPYGFSQNISSEIIVANGQLHEFFGSLARINDKVYCIYTSEPKDSSELYSNSRLMSIDNTGDTVWFDFDKADSNLRLLDIIPIDNGNLVLGGNILTPFEHRKKKQWFCEITPNYEIVWETIIDLEKDSTSTTASCLGKTYNGNYLYVANVFDQTNYDRFMYATTISNNGDSINSHIFDVQHTGRINSITQGEYCNELHVAHSDFGSPYNCKIHCIDSNYTTLTFSQYPIYAYDDPFYTIKISSNKFLSFGRYWFKGFYGLKAIVFDTIDGIIANTSLTDGLANTYPAWNQGVDYYYDNKIYVAGMLDVQGAFPTSPNECYIACLNENLEVVQEYLVGGDGYYHVYNVSATSDGGVIVSGSFYDHLSASEQNDAFLFKIDSSSFVGTSEIINSEDEHIDLYPNPATNTLNIRYPISDPSTTLRAGIRYSISIYDLFGRQMYGVQVPAQEESIQVDVSSYPSGVYFVVLKDDNGIVARKKFIVK